MMSHSIIEQGSETLSRIVIYGLGTVGMGLSAAKEVIPQVVDPVVANVFIGVIALAVFVRVCLDVARFIVATVRGKDDRK